MSIFRRSHDLDDRIVETLVSGHTPAARPDLAALAELLHEARAAGPTEGPSPSDRLAALFDKGVVPVTVPLRSAPVVRRRRRNPAAAAWRVSLLGSAAVAAVLLAAEANSLPAPAQTAVANVVEALTPLTLPRPTTATTTPTRPLPSVGPKVVVPHRPAPRPTSKRVASPAASPSRRLVGPDVVILPPPGQGSPEPSSSPSTEPEPSPTPAG